MEVLKIFSNCKIIKGYSQAVVYDLQRHNFFLIPNDLYHLIRENEGENLIDIKKFYENKYDNIIDEYISFLLDNELAFFCTNVENFPNISLEFSSPSIISNSIITEQNEYSYYIKFIEFLDKSNCKAVQLRFFSEDSFGKVKDVLKLFNNTSIQDIEIIMPCCTKKTLSDFKKMFFEYQRIWNIRLYNCNESKIEFVDRQKEHAILYTNKNIENHDFCGTIYPNNFVQNISFFTESLSYNTCLYKKLSIDENGYIKNCPSMTKHYGHISNTNIKEVVQSKEFQQLWHIKKDDILVCQNCEFRHMCTDCRAYIRDPNNIYSQPAKCPYNPYIAKWEEQEGYITVKQWQKQNPNWEQKAKEQRQIRY